MGKKYIIALDQGTTSSRAIIFNERSEIVHSKQAELAQIYPHAGWVEQSPMDIYSSQYSVLSEVIASSNIMPDEIAAIGITNQRETSIVWDAKTGEPVYNAIVWQCRRTAAMAERLRDETDFSAYVQQATGLIIDAYFSATKIAWILNHIEEGYARAKRGELLFGTVDSWLLWKFTGGKVHATDYTNASRTMLFNINTLTWDTHILEKLGIPQEMLPTVYPSSYHFGEINIGGTPIPICGIAGDQQASLFGQMCFQAGEMKNTYGTGCFLLMNTGDKKYVSESGLLTTICAGTSSNVQYALEGSVFIGGAVIQWLRDELAIIQTASETSAMASSLPSNDGVYFVPAFTGLATPHWDMDARGMLIGLTRGTTKQHIVRAALEGIAYQVNDIIRVIEKETQLPITSLQVDGGASRNNFLMQFQADISNIEITKRHIVESTALGAAYLAGLAEQFWENQEAIMSMNKVAHSYTCTMHSAVREKQVSKWQSAVKRSLDWHQEDGK